jgi:hypothetical protein
MAAQYRCLVAACWQLPNHPALAQLLVKATTWNAHASPHASEDVYCSASYHQANHADAHYAAAAAAAAAAFLFLRVPLQ